MTVDDQMVEMVVFPAHAGMNRVSRNIQDAYEGVPRTRGDEPVTLYPSVRQFLCSPHTRG